MVEFSKIFRLRSAPQDIYSFYFSNIGQKFPRKNEFFIRIFIFCACGAYRQLNRRRIFVKKCHPFFMGIKGGHKTLGKKNYCKFCERGIMHQKFWFPLAIVEWGLTLK